MADNKQASPQTEENRPNFILDYLALGVNILNIVNNQTPTQENLKGILESEDTRKLFVEMINKNFLVQKNDPPKNDPPKKENLESPTEKEIDKSIETIKNILIDPKISQIINDNKNGLSGYIANGMTSYTSFIRPIAIKTLFTADRKTILDIYRQRENLQAMPIGDARFQKSLIEKADILEFLGKNSDVLKSLLDGYDKGPYNKEIKDLVVALAPGVIDLVQDKESRKSLKTAIGKSFNDVSKGKIDEKSKENSDPNIFQRLGIDKEFVKQFLSLAKDLDSVEEILQLYNNSEYLKCCEKLVTSLQDNGELKNYIQENPKVISDLVNNLGEDILKELEIDKEFIGKISSLATDLDSVEKILTSYNDKDKGFLKCCEDLAETLQKPNHKDLKKYIEEKPEVISNLVTKLVEKFPDTIGKKLENYINKDKLPKLLNRALKHTKELHEILSAVNKNAHLTTAMKVTKLAIIILGDLGEEASQVISSSAIAAYKKVAEAGSESLDAMCKKYRNIFNPETTTKPVSTKNHKLGRRSRSHSASVVEARAQRSNSRRSLTS